MLIVIDLPALSMLRGPEASNIRAICQLSTGNHWRVRGSAVGDSLNLLCLVLLGDVRYSFITTFDITETSAKSTAE